MKAEFRRNPCPCFSITSFACGIPPTNALNIILVYVDIILPHCAQTKWLLFCDIEMFERYR